jgi:putative transposase
MAERGVTLTYEAVRYWCRKFGQTYTTQLRCRRPRPAGTWHPDEVLLTIHGGRHYLWRAVDQDGDILDILIQRRHNTAATKEFFRKLVKGLTYVPPVVVTDELRSYEAAKRELLPGVEHRQHRYLNSRAENSHQPTRQRERTMRRFKSAGQAQRYLTHRMSQPCDHTHAVGICGILHLLAWFMVHRHVHEVRAIWDRWVDRPLWRLGEPQPIIKRRTAAPFR